MKILDEYFKWPNIKSVCIYIHETKGTGFNVQPICNLHHCWDLSEFIWI